jgi:hypothetical protein
VDTTTAAAPGCASPKRTGAGRQVLDLGEADRVA